MKVMLLKQPNKPIVNGWIAIAIAVLSVFGFILFVGLYDGILSKTISKEGPTWNGVTPGISSLEDVTTLLGTPTDTTFFKELHPFFTDQSAKLWIYQYDEINDPETGKLIEVKFWVEEVKDKQKIIAIFIDYSEYNRPRDLPYLSELAKTYSIPDEVTWSDYCGYRRLFWTRQGIMAQSGFSEVLVYLSKPWVKARITEKFLFAPMTYRQYKKSFWPAELQPVDKSQCTGREDYPQNPFNWEQILK